MLREMVLKIRNGIEMKREHGAAYSSETNTVAAPATVSGETGNDDRHWETGKAVCQVNDPRARRPAATSRPWEMAGTDDK